jgi:hypothetical protein
LVDTVCPSPPIDNLEEFFPALLESLGGPSLRLLPAPNFLLSLPLLAFYFRLTFSLLDKASDDHGFLLKLFEDRFDLAAQITLLCFLPPFNPVSSPVRRIGLQAEPAGGVILLRRPSDFACIRAPLWRDVILHADVFAIDVANIYLLRHLDNRQGKQKYRRGFQRFIKRFKTI